ncbi:MAG TPA: tRNA uridine-5-carboxymethylaminomethyl(34) synthesis GTPase MnmE [Thermoanaerobaculia bacterium]
MRPQTDSLLDTIVALATPLGRSALATLRVSGRRTRNVLSAVMRDSEESLAPRRPRLVSLVDASGETIDRGLVTFFAAPSSATGEDVGELSIHGSPVVVQSLLSALVAAGARPARPGEFTERAFILGKIDLVEAEAIRDLIEARTAAAARVSTRRLEGRLSARFSEIKEKLLDAAAALTATIDFAEDAGERIPPEAIAKLSGAAAALGDIARTYETGKLLSAGCRVVILGPPNAGKSTLFNALVGSERAIVTEIPGTTRDTLEAVIDVEGVPVEIVDTAGLRETQDTVERIGVERARRASQEADAVIYVFDAEQGWTAADAQAIAQLDGKPAVTVANKADRLGRGRMPPCGTPLCGLEPEAATTLRGLLRETVARDLETDSSSDVLGTLRQKELVERARAGAVGALGSISAGESPEYAATHVASALDALADLVGETTNEDVLARIFATFCIGK